MADHLLLHQPCADFLWFFDLMHELQSFQEWNRQCIVDEYLRTSLDDFAGIRFLRLLQFNLADMSFNQIFIFLSEHFLKLRLESSIAINQQLVPAVFQYISSNWFIQKVSISLNDSVNFSLEFINCRFECQIVLAFPSCQTDIFCTILLMFCSVFFETTDVLRVELHVVFVNLADNFRETQILDFSVPVTQVIQALHSHTEITHQCCSDILIEDLKERLTG